MSFEPMVRIALWDALVEKYRDRYSCPDKTPDPKGIAALINDVCMDESAQDARATSPAFRPTSAQNLKNWFVRKPDGSIYPIRSDSIEKLELCLGPIINTASGTISVSAFEKGDPLLRSDSAAESSSRSKAQNTPQLNTPTAGATTTKSFSLDWKNIASFALLLLAFLTYCQMKPMPISQPGSTQTQPLVLPQAGSVTAGCSIHLTTTTNHRMIALNSAA